MKIILSAGLILFHVLSLFSQEKVTRQPVLKKIAADCKDAIPLTLAWSCQYGPNQAPNSFGALQEITSSDKNSEVSFSQEHNSSWYLLKIRFDGELTFEIVPEDSTNDYDFLLYAYPDSSLCSSILNRSVRPIRSNISGNVEPYKNPATGLSATVTQEFRRQGIGNPFSKSVEVKKGEKYMLVLDNVTQNGKGYTIYFHCLAKVEIQGKVLGPDSLPLVADVELSDGKGKIVGQTTTDVKGKYEIRTIIEGNTDYNLTFSNDSSFIGTRTINTADLKSDSHTFSDIRTVLPKLKKGTKYPLGNINFYGGEARVLPESFPSVTALYHLMKKNKQMVIQIEGHVNASRDKKEDWASPGYQSLSEERAEAVRQLLLNSGIASARITTIGFAGTQMLFPRAVNEFQERANRRVEIKVISINGE